MITPTETTCRPRWELLALGGGSYGAPNVFQGVWATVRLRYLNRVPFVLEAGAMFPEGAVFSLMTDAWRDRRWRLHFPDFGFLYYIGHPNAFNRPDVPRRWDLILGAGGEWQFVPDAWLTLDVRFFLPDPTAVPFRYGGFTLPIYRDSAQGVQFWIGIGKRIW